MGARFSAAQAKKQAKGTAKNAWLSTNGLIPKLPPYHQHHQEETTYTLMMKKIISGQNHPRCLFHKRYIPTREANKTGV